MASAPWEWLVSIILVAVYAWRRFNTPARNRYSTTTGRYYLSAFLYLTSLEFLLAALSSLAVLSPAAFMLLLQGGELTDEHSKLPAPLLSALLLTTLLPNFETLSRFDNWLRISAWQIGHIPRMARRLSASIRQAQHNIPKAFHNAVESELGADFAKYATRFSVEDTIEHRWTKLAALFVIIEDWEKQNIQKGDWSDEQKDNWLRYDNLHKHLSEDYELIVKEFAPLKDKAKTFFSTTENADKDDAVAIQYRITFDGEISRFYEVLTLYLARALLRREPNNKHRKSMLASLGFLGVQMPADSRLGINQVVGAALGVFSILIVVSGGISRLFEMSGQFSIRRLMLIATMVAIIYGLAIAAAIYPKSAWRIADIRRSNGRPWLGYLCSGLLAGTFAAIVSFLFRTIELGGFINALKSFYWVHPWFVSTAVVAVVIAILADNSFGKPEPKWLRWVEGVVVLCVLMAIILVVVHPWLLELRQETGTEIPAWVGASKAPVWFRPPENPLRIGIPAGLIGFALGFFVPHWYRVTPEIIDNDE